MSAPRSLVASQVVPGPVVPVPFMPVALALAVALLVAMPGAGARAAEAIELPADSRERAAEAIERAAEAIERAAEAIELPAEWTSPLRIALAAVSPEGLEAPPGVADAEVEPAAAPLPECEYRDKLTRFHKVRHWRKTLVDTILRVKRSYKPWDLVSVSRANISGSGMVRKVVIADLKAMAAAARRAGKPLAVRSAYRSYATQVATFRSWVRRSGYQQALKFSARPGHSEHQLGTTIDFTTAPGVPLSSSFGESPQGKWIAKHGWKHGFIMSYPKGRRKASCYGYEPWHWRYVGKRMARAIHESGQVPRRYLWENHESVP